MSTEALLSYAHLLAILTLVVFISSQAALCRLEWLNAPVVERLVTLDRVYGVAALAVFGTGVARALLGAKGAGWYAGNWLFWTKLAAFVVVGAMSLRPTLRFLRWRRTLRTDGRLPGPDEVRQVRRWVMRQAHLIALIPLAAVFLARGYGN